MVSAVCVQIGRRVVERDLERQQVELKQQVAGLDGLALVDVDRETTTPDTSVVTRSLAACT